MGTACGALALCPAIVDGKQQGITLLVHQALSNGMDAHIASGLAFQPTRPAFLRLALHPPTPDFRSATPHFYHSTF